MKTKSHKMCVKFCSTLFLNIRTIFRRATDEIKKKNNLRTCYRNTPSLKMIKTTFSYAVENGEDLVLPVKVVRNSFPFSIPAELYERLTRL